MRSAIENVCIKTVSVFVLLFGFVFSLNAFGMVGDLIKCESVDYNSRLKVFKKEPNDILNIYHLGIGALCTGRTDEGIKHIKQASNRGHIMASEIVALHYKTDGTLDSSAKLTKDPVNFDKMLFYYERAAEQIESARNYPEGVTEDMPYLEEHSWTSAKVFVSLPALYYRGYGRSVGGALRGEADYVDTIEVLHRMRDAADRCLDRPSLSVWNGRREIIANALQVRCQAMWDFSDNVISLEEERIRIARNCSVALRDCPEHKQVMEQLTQLAREMRSNPPVA